MHNKNYKGEVDMKKIISFAAAIVMMVSAAIPAFAAEKQYPADSYDPTAIITVNKEAGPDEDGYYDYSMTIDLENLGTVYETGKRSKSGLKIVSLSMDVRGDKSMDIGMSSSDKSGNIGGIATLANTKAYTGSDAAGLNIVYFSSAADEAYPTGGATTTECKGAITVNFWSMEGEITVSNATLGYLPFEDGAIKANHEQAIAEIKLPVSTFKIGEPVPEKVLDLNVNLAGKYDNGYVWNAEISEGKAALDKFEATFTADEASVDRAVTNVADMAGKFTGEGKLAFNIGLDTTKTLTGATFTVGAGEETKTVAAPLN